MRTKCALAAHLRALAVCKALFTSPRGVHPRGAFLCNRNGVSYYTKTRPGNPDLFCTAGISPAE
mgnify:CR=1 FL=1